MAVSCVRLGRGSHAQKLMKKLQEKNGLWMDGLTDGLMDLRTDGLSTINLSELGKT